MKSVAGRLRTSLPALLFALFLMIFASGDRLARTFADEMTWQQLTERTRWIGSILIHSGARSLDRDDPCPEPEGSGRYCQWEWMDQGRRHRHLSPSLLQKPIELPPLPSGGHLELKTMAPVGEEIMLVVQSFERAEGRLIVATGQSIQGQRDLTRRWRMVNLATICGIFILAMIGFPWLVSEAFSPFRRLHRELERLLTGERQRLSPEGPEETLPLVRLIDRLLLAEERHQHRVRRTLSHLGHSLKIPVTSLIHLADAPELRDHEALRTTLAEQSQLLERLIERQLRRASLSGKNGDHDRFRLGRELSSLVRALNSLHYDKELDIETRIPETLNCPGHRDDILEMIGNLADNACKWARSHVLIAAGDEGGFWMTIEDDGPGVEAEGLDRLRRSIQHPVDEQTRTTGGLGLLIAQDIVELYEGQILLGRSPELGGFLVRIRLP
ncbi:MAG: sensor histidine kinase [Magnetococcales bacterium]|nr:sensor histidine kinase [Magnetococcales bacterium]